MMSRTRTCYLASLGLSVVACGQPPAPADSRPSVHGGEAPAAIQPPATVQPPAPIATPPKPKEAAPIPDPKPPAAVPAEGPRLVRFDADEAGAPSPAFEAVVGDWYVGEADGQKGLWVDGSRWRQGTPSASLADQAKRLYGERYAEFLDNVKAFAFFPLAVYTGEAPSGDMRMSINFYPEAGRIDQAAGIVWNVAPDGSYWGARANALEDNILIFRYHRGKRTILQTVRGTSTPSKKWHSFAVTLKAGEVVVELDGKEWLRRAFTEPIAGRVGLWSKADSKVLIRDFTIEAMTRGREPSKSAP